MMYNKTIVFLCLILNALALWSQESKAQQDKWDREGQVHNNPLVDYQPTALPDRIVFLPGRTSDELIVTWRTDTSGTDGWIDIIPSNGILFDEDDEQRIRSTTTSVIHKDYPMLYHRAVVTAVQAGKSYQYRVGNREKRTVWDVYEHRVGQDTIEMLYFGDAQNGIYDYAGKLYFQAFKKFPNAELAIHTGDLINHANNDYEWAEWHAATGHLNRSMPLITTPGNHEYLKNLDGKKVQLSDYWLPSFPFPYAWEQGPFIVDHSFIRFIVLNSNNDIYPQGKWLDSVLTETRHDWTIILTHHPVFSGAKNRENKGLLDNWLPVIEKHKDKVGLVLQGHDHTYARGGLPHRTGSAALPTQPVFTVSVVGDKYYPLERQSWMDTSYDRVSSYQWISVSRDKIVYKAFSETNSLIDSFVLEKDN